MAEPETTGDKVDNGFNIMGLGLPTLEGWWRGGLPGAGKKMNWPMLEKFAGVDPGAKTAGTANGAPNGGGVNALGVLGTLGSAYGMVSGIGDAVNGFCDDGIGSGKGWMGVLNAGLGGVGTFGGLANMANVAATTGTGALATIQNVAHGMTSMGGAGLGGGGLAGNIGQASTWVGRGAGAAGVGTALSTVASVAGAGIAGYNLGQYGNKHAEETGILGQRADGKNKSVSDYMWDKGSAADDNVTNFIGGEKGAIRSGVGGVLGTIANIGTQAVTGLYGTGKSVLDGLVGTGIGAGFDAVDGVRDWASTKHFNPIKGARDTFHDVHQFFQPQPVDPARESSRPFDPIKSVSDTFHDVHQFFQPQPVGRGTLQPTGNRP